MSEQNKKEECKIAEIMLLIVVAQIFIIMKSINVKTIILTSFNGIVFFKVITMIFLISTVTLNLISSFLYISVLNSESENKCKFKAGNILFLISLCLTIVLFVLIQCA